MRVMRRSFIRKPSLKKSFKAREPKEVLNDQLTQLMVRKASEH